MAQTSTHFDQQVTLESDGSRPVQLIADARGIFFDGAVKALTIDFKRVHLDQTAPGRVHIQTNDALFQFRMQTPDHARRLVEVLRVPLWILAVEPSEAEGIEANAAAKSSSSTAGWVVLGMTFVLAIAGAVVALVANDPEQNAEAEAQRAITEATNAVVTSVADGPARLEANAEAERIKAEVRASQAAANALAHAEALKLAAKNRAARPDVPTEAPRPTSYSVELIDGAVQIEGGLPPATVNSLLRNGASAFGRCYESSGLQTASTFAVRVTVDTGGSIASASVEGAGASARCIMDVTRRWHYPRRDAATTITAKYKVAPVP